MQLSRRAIVASTAALAAAPALASRVAFAPATFHAEGVSPHFRAALDALTQRARVEIEAWGYPAITLCLTGPNGQVGVASVGFANPDARLPVTPQHLFHIGSISKSFVAVALLRLSDMGRIDLDRPLLEIAPDYPLEDRRVTVAHVLDHAAGFPGNSPPFANIPGGKLWSAWDPGSRFSYSNTGYDLMGLLVARISGMPFAEALETLVMRPLGMTATKPTIQIVDRKLYAGGYTPLRYELPYFPGDPLTPGPWPTVDRAAGSVASTPGDMAKWVAFIGHCADGGAQPVLSPASAKRFTTGVITAPDFGDTARYGMGLASVEIDKLPALHHTGGMLAFSSSMHVDRATGLGCFASVSIDGLLGYRPRVISILGMQMARALAAGAALPAAPPVETLKPNTDGSEFAGRWLGANGLAIDIAPDAATLSSGGVSGRLRRMGGRRFGTDHPRLFDHALEFEPEKGAAQRLWWGGVPLARDAAPPLPAVPPEMAALAGLYRSNDPWAGSIGVVARGDRLLVEGMGELKRQPGGWWAVDDAPNERFWFGSVANGQAQRISFSGESYLRAA